MQAVFAVQEVSRVPAGQFLLPVLIEEEGFVFKNVDEEGELNQVYRLRHRVFCDELRWVGEKKTSRNGTATMTLPFPSVSSMIRAGLRRQSEPSSVLTRSCFRTNFPSLSRIARP
jgi:hypothetical protein